MLSASASQIMTTEQESTRKMIVSIFRNWYKPRSSFSLFDDVIDQGPRVGTLIENVRTY